MKYHLILQNIIDDPNIPEQKTLEQWLKHTLSNRVASAEVCLRIVDETESAELNSYYRGKNKPTNILSFPSEIPEEIPQEIPILGDLVVCSSIVAQEAKEQNKTLEAHWAHMLIHGLLHLLGYDHIEDQEAEIMEGIEINLLQQLGYPNPYREITHE